MDSNLEILKNTLMCTGTSSGRLSQLFHFGPIIAIFLIGFITYCGYFCLVQWWPPISTIALIHMTIYLSWPLVIFYNYFNAVFLGPGFVPKNWKPANKEDELKLQYCKLCEGFKAPRSHHCRKCQRCVFKMDHHCPWINTCCGHRNHASFVYFLFTAPLGCLHALVVLSISIYRAIFKNYYAFYYRHEPQLDLSFIELVFCMFAAGMALGVSVSVMFLLFIQVKSIIKNQTGIESWIVLKAHHRRKFNKSNEKFIYPYHLGYMENVKQVLNWSGDFRPIGNGTIWNVREGCDQFTLTIEQMLQKEEKRVHSVQYRVTTGYAGTLFPLKFGCKTFCCFPWTEDPRLVLFEEDLIQVTRWQKHWLYGEVHSSDKKLQRRDSKGWFPKGCVILNERIENSQEEATTKKEGDKEGDKKND